MFVVTLICSDEACAEEVEAWVELGQLDTLACDGCGCTLQAIAFAEPGGAAGTRLSGRPRDPDQTHMRIGTPVTGSSPVPIARARPSRRLSAVHSAA